MIELPEFVTDAVIERTHARAVRIQDGMREGAGWARRWVIEGMNRARARDPKMLAFLERAATHLQKKNDEQKSRFAQEGFATTEFAEYGTWRAAYLKAAEQGERDEGVMYRVFGSVYGAAAEALARGG